MVFVRVSFISFSTSRKGYKTQVWLIRAFLFMAPWLVWEWSWARWQDNETQPWGFCWNYWNEKCPLSRMACWKDGWWEQVWKGCNREWIQTEESSHETERETDQVLTTWMEPLDPGDLQPVLCWTFQLSPSEVGFFYHTHASSAQHRAWHRVGTL